MRELGAFLRQQRTAADLSVRQLSALTGISNPYLSQIERGLRRPSAEILQQIAQGLSLSAETLYVRAGLLQATRDSESADTSRAIRADPRLDIIQRRAMLEAYARIIGEPPYDRAAAPVQPSKAATECPADEDLFPEGNRYVPQEDRMNAPGSKGAPSRASTEISALTPIYVMLGASDLAVEKLRELGAKAAKDAEESIDGLQQKAGNDLAKVVEGAKQVPHLALNQALEMMARSRQHYTDLAERGRSVDLTGQATTTALGLMQQATDLVGRGRSQAEHVVEQGRTEAERRVDKTRKAALRTGQAAVHQAGAVVDQASHVVEAVTHAGRRAVDEAVDTVDSAVAAPVRKPTARRRRSPGSTAATASPAASPAASPVVQTASVPADEKKSDSPSARPTKKATARRSSTATSRTTGGERRASTRTPAKRTERKTTARKATTRRTAASPSDMPATAAVPPPPSGEVVAEAAKNSQPGSSPSAQLPPHGA
ncbi:Transcriptional regulator, contains XRE-family HTH domain [Austwickia chelonae]|nr:Transcriptional regulator, contains XRE-family HTH domain [Austwickia chelonae]